MDTKFKKRLVPWNKGKTGIYSEETRRKIGLAIKGRKLSEEHKRKISSSLIGREVSEETKKKIGISNKGKPAWNKGIKTGQIHKRIINNFRKRINKREKTASILAG